MKTEVVIREYCIKKLAQILYDCVECPGDRAKIDWATAQNHIDGNRWVVDTVMENLIKKWVNDHKKWVNDHVRERILSNQIIVNNDHVRERILRNQIIVNIECNFERFDQLFGRYIWNACYQRIKPILPRPPYQRILFH
ncbi:hypothetical protein KKC83_06060 [Patescibacteria group bacterium]|nr:hypothetical protein [Candidatus Falkowbacteria bacterium]MBU3905985.1 hypothetical protein [Patescibacteria group bacterium]MBU4015649.1 hypothetical protein [Patescibacteria group bacterium]MBU4027079.1 hypothetical protein [Patescibacteria group bacterium]MBU4072751.1 hypothetical protein [Patescibacteria group bacterium]